MREDSNLQVLCPVLVFGLYLFSATGVVASTGRACGLITWRWQVCSSGLLRLEFAQQDNGERRTRGLRSPCGCGDGEQLHPGSEQKD